MPNDNKLLNSRKFKNFKNDIRRDLLLYVMLLLPIMYYIIFRYSPLYGITIAFKDYNMFEGITKSKWIGLAVFREIFAMPEFYRALRNTLLLNILDLVLSFPAPIILAIILNELKINWYKRVAQTLLYLPYFLSWVIIGGIAYQLLSPFSGVVNVVIKALGGKAVPFLTENVHWIFTYVVTGIWQSAGWGTIIYLAAISGINEELYEAAEVDGAGRLRKIWHITLPCIRGTIVILLIMSLGRIMSISFERPFTMGNALVADYSDVISTFVYRVGIRSARYSVATAVGLFQSLVGMIMLVSANLISKKAGDEGIW